MLAHIQKILTLTILLAASVWATYWWNMSHVVAATGFAAIALGYALFLALEFVILYFVGKRNGFVRPTNLELVHAWMVETRTAPLVFCWRQPFRANAVPDSPNQRPGDEGLRGVVLVHGFFCNRGFWTPWLNRLNADGHPFVAVNLEPVLGSIDRYADIIDAAVTRLTVETGVPPVIVCHSMGGLAARSWLRTHHGHKRVHHIVTIGTPHGGTWLGRFSRAANGKQMRLESEWLHSLAKHEESSQGPPFTCWYSNCDNIVFPAETATLRNADNRHVRGAAHVQLAFHPEVMNGSLAIIRAM